MGEETQQFATAFTLAVERLARLAAGEAAPPGKARVPGAPGIAEALDAVAAVYGTGTTAVRNWPEQRRKVLAQIEEVRAALAASGDPADLRAKARALVAIVGPAAGPG